MKKLLTIISGEAPETDGLCVPEKVEILHAKGAFTRDIFKSAKGKYALLAEGDLICDLTDGFFTAMDKTNADILVAGKSFCFKTSIFKSLNKNCRTDKFSAEIFAAFSSGSVAKLAFNPFDFSPTPKTEYSDDERVALVEALNEFKKVKSSLGKDVYTFCSDYLCRALTGFYLRAVLAVHYKKLEAEAIKDFDKILKENPVLHMTFLKRFTAFDLQKIREKNYKISFITANKIKKSIG